MIVQKTLVAAGFSLREGSEFKGLYGPDNKMIISPEKKERVKRTHIVRYFSYAAEKKLLGLASSIKGNKAARDRMIMDIGLDLGLRVAEAASLTVGHVRNRTHLTIVGKGNKTRTIPIKKELQRAIHAFIRQKLVWKEMIHDDAPLFISKKGAGFSKRSMQETFEKWCIRAGLTISDGRAAYTFHCMRHTCAMRLRERGYSIEQVAEYLGHTSLNSTRVYFRPSMEELEEMAESL
jgi:site-specific recombinase XerD